MRYYLLIILVFLICSCINQNHKDSTDTVEKLSSSDEIQQVEYSLLFRKFTSQYFGSNFNSRWFICQAKAESRINPNATSPVGARGIMQIMPSTYDQINKKLDIQNITDPASNIQAGIYYDKRLYIEWTVSRPFKHRMAFTFASYNAGLHNVLKGQVKCQESKCETCNLWSSVAQYGDQVNTWRQEETIGYVDRIFRFMNKELR